MRKVLSRGKNIPFIKFRTLYIFCIALVIDGPRDRGVHGEQGIRGLTDKGKEITKLTSPNGPFFDKKGQD